MSLSSLVNVICIYITEIAHGDRNDDDRAASSTDPFSSISTFIASPAVAPSAFDDAGVLLPTISKATTATYCSQYFYYYDVDTSDSDTSDSDSDAGIANSTKNDPGNDAYRDSAGNTYMMAEGAMMAVSGDDGDVAAKLYNTGSTEGRTTGTTANGGNMSLDLVVGVVDRLASAASLTAAATAMAASTTERSPNSSRMDRLSLEDMQLFIDPSLSSKIANTYPNGSNNVNAQGTVSISVVATTILQQRILIADLTVFMTATSSRLCPGDERLVSSVASLVPTRSHNTPRSAPSLLP
ncbi:hypothetical protein BSLG_003797 [Batrachochytrium salamandrivorans]|nr:hypothetical protein BSLG_003797 [Batrachochytrium salamandrivorans]